MAEIELLHHTPRSHPNIFLNTPPNTSNEKDASAHRRAHACTGEHTCISTTINRRRLSHLITTSDRRPFFAMAPLWSYFTIINDTMTSFMRRSNSLIQSCLLSCQRRVRRPASNQIFTSAVSKVFTAANCSRFSQLVILFTNTITILSASQ